MTDVPAAAREDLADAAPAAADAGAPTRPADGGTHPQDALAAARRRARRERAHGLPGPRHGLHLQPGRLRDGLPVLRHRPGRADRNLSAGRDHRPGGAAAAAGDGELPANRGGCPTSSSWAWASRWPTTPRGRETLDASVDPGAARARPLRSARSPCRRSGWSRRSQLAAEEDCTSPSRSACTPRTTSCATPWCRSTPAGRSVRSLEAADATRAPTGRRYSIEYALIRDVNDQPWRADLLGRLLAAAARRVHVNLIPLNPTPGQPVGRLPAPGAARVRPPSAGRRRGLHRPRHPRPGHRRRLRPARRHRRPV